MRPLAPEKPAARKGRTMHSKCNLSEGLRQAHDWKDGYLTGQAVAAIRGFGAAKVEGKEAAIFSALLAHQGGRLV